MKRTTSFTLLILSLLFSHFIIFSFKLSEGFESIGFKFQLFPLLAFTEHHSGNQFLTSSIIGYILFAVFLLTNFMRAIAATPKSFYIALILCVASILFELYSFVCEYTGNDSGRYLRIGFPLFVLCYYVFNAIYKGETMQFREDNVARNEKHGK